MHEDGDVLADDLLGERHESLGDIAKNDAWIARRIDIPKLGDHFGEGGNARAHRLAEQLELRRRMTQHRGGRDVELRGDVRQCRGVKTLRGEYPPRGFQELFARNPRRPAHL